MTQAVTIRPIDEGNFLDAFRLELSLGREKYVSGPIRSLAHAYVYREQCQPFGIYAGERMVGYVMVIYDYDILEYDIWHMMIDRAHQGRGYGKKALERCLEYIRTKPFGGSNRVALTCHEGNSAALGLYAGLGFLPTGQRDGEEIELALELTT